MLIGDNQDDALRKSLREEYQFFFMFYGLLLNVILGFMGYSQFFPTASQGASGQTIVTNLNAGQALQRLVAYFSIYSDNFFGVTVLNTTTVMLLIGPTFFLWLSMNIFTKNAYRPLIMEDVDADQSGWRNSMPRFLLSGLLYVCSALSAIFVAFMVDSPRGVAFFFVFYLLNFIVALILFNRVVHKI